MYQIPVRRRAVSALASLAMVAAGGAALILGLSAQPMISKAVSETLVVLSSERVVPPPEPRRRPTPPAKPVPADEAQASRPKDKASPKNLLNQASAAFAPVLPPLRTPPPIVAAPRPTSGDGPNTGRSDRVGPGQGAGGSGNGTGGGGNGGSGDGDGDGDGDSNTRPVQTHGKLYWSDLPKALREAHAGGVLELVYKVNTDGRVSDCRVTKSSGYPDLDLQTCRLITKRFRFRPSRDPSGRAVPAMIEETHGWYSHPEDEPDWKA